MTPRSALDDAIIAIQSLTLARYALTQAEAEAARTRAAAVSELQAQGREPEEIAALLGEASER